MGLCKLVVGLIFAVNAACALTCYKCDSSESIGCNYGLISFTYSTMDCNEGGSLLAGFVPKSCVKVVAKNEKGEEYVARGCMPSIGEGVCNAIVKSAGFFSSLQNNENLQTTCSTCNEDKCNSAPKFAATSFVALAVAIVAFLF
ncbi:unnamed protein product [Brassicogethes aeneus]|uniref:Protein sleepless n=1 Tax=Brassicogethes aeneus TaxID=1431903 RepID=A0A9P0FNJ1_BRAAE|nr:unnamed protein product [Brassicogethes aeneus]